MLPSKINILSSEDLFPSPVSGKVADVNGELTDSPEKINEDPYGSWMIAVEMSNSSELNELLSAAEYQKWCAEEG
jgi:glycine cleavage system H protein